MDVWLSWVCSDFAGDINTYTASSLRKECESFQQQQGQVSEARRTTHSKR